MESNALRNVGDLQDDKKRLLEDLLGVELEAGQEIFIMAYTPGLVPDAATRKAALDRLRSLIAEAQANVQKQGIKPGDSDAIDEAMERIRYGE